EASPLGLYPEVDLLRLLRMDDIAHYYSGASGGYQLIPQGIGTDDYSTYSPTVARNIGLTSYNALRLSLFPESAQVVTDPTFDLPTSAAVGPPRYPLSGDARTHYYTDLGAQDGASYHLAANTKTFRLNSRFTTADLLELLTRRTENDPTSVSRFEQVV